jgi:hypothetical protein
MGILGLVRAPEINLTEEAHDPEYGYTPEHPVKVGGFFETSSHRNQHLFLRQLAGPRGEKLTFQRVGSCCPFSSGWSRDLNAGMKLDRGNFYLVGTASFIGGAAGEAVVWQRSRS